ncbi:ankyrin repeat, PH and SEC7 domain containing protein secG-like isoform X1 [Crassostrea angulata]|uniref:ankyrin repeat, PH and SEC7 domain containing protein secG-like isoform X1 n=1 Tax=Magallana angulata TaxID=2784310 RepID=UPI0005C3D3AE|nr:ankyrin repeat, PH and SEC7 domain containing protein secG-like isoform X1 [Crassostrea angulata]|eukprot:XP_011424210.1 PREDICTED: ankyrin repeat, PH and SEC7 domain containing protein secG-like isoform X1 [Crassostrea gigas]
MANNGQQLHSAVRNKDKESIERLLDSGADVNCMVYGWTPLQLSLQRGYEEGAVVLIDRGCDVHLHDKNSVSPFEECLRKNLIKVLTKIVNKGEDVNAVLSNGEPPVCEAVKNASKDVLSVLIKVGKCNVNTVGSKGESPLFTAAKSGYSDICRLLLDAGADPDFILPANQHTPLITAASNDNDDVIKVLLKHGCNVNHCDVMGKSALWHAYSNSNTDSMKLLLRAGSDKNIPNAEGQTLLDDAKDAEDDDVIELLTKFTQSWT